MISRVEGINTMEFNTIEDVHTVMKYKKQTAIIRGIDPILVTVDLDSKRSELRERLCKIKATAWLCELIK